MLRPPAIGAPLCRRGCGVVGVHPTFEDCLAAQRDAIAAFQVGVPSPRIPPPIPTRARRTRTVIPDTIKTQIVDQMFLAGPGQVVATARALGAEASIPWGTIVTSWRRWARDRD